MASAAESPSILEEYSQSFTRLQAGKRELIKYGADAVRLNRFIIDTAGATGQADTAPVLQGIDVNKVTQGNTDAERRDYCETALKKLVALQEEVVVLQKSAREAGISGGLLTIVGQAACQSPEDNGASVLRQLSELVFGQESEKQESESSDQTASTMSLSCVATSVEEHAANDIEQPEQVQVTGFQQLVYTLANHWRSLVVDASVCAIAAGIAISLIN